MIFVALNVSDLARSTAFYRAAFGIDLHAGHNDPEADRWYGGEHSEHSWTDGAFLHFAIFPSSPPERPVTRDAQIGFGTDDLSAAHARAVGAGAQVVHDPRDEPWGATARYRDPDGNLVSLTQNSSA
jgi:predicted enzyme related to lactoylglutathione lyase